jgi:S1-C subfamily serine protease
VVGASLGVVVVLVAGLVAAYGLVARPSWLPLGRHDQPKPLTTAQVIAAAQSSVVMLNVDVFRTGTAQGFGFIYGKPAHVLTTARVIANARKIQVTGATGGSYEAGLLGVDRAGNVAELSIIDYVTQPIRPAKKAAAVGSAVMLIGNTAGGSSSGVTDGKVAGTEQDVAVGSTSYHNLLQMDVVGTDADRGQPVINRSGELVGMVAVVRGSSVYAIPVAGLDGEARSWAQTDKHINVGPPLVSVDASKLVVPGARIPGGFQQVVSEPWGNSGYHVRYKKQPTYTEGGETIDSWVDVDLNEGSAIVQYQSEMATAAETRTKEASGEIGDGSTTWFLLSGVHVLYEVIWRDRNVAAVMYWTAALPNSEISQANLEQLAAAQEDLISADLASYQPAV